MRRSLLFLIFATSAHADVTLPSGAATDPGILSCAAELERLGARAKAGLDGLPAWYGDVSVAVSERRVAFEGRFGDMCMGHDEYTAEVTLSPGPDTRWSKIYDGDVEPDGDPNQRLTKYWRRKNGLRATVSALAGNWGNDTRVFVPAYRRALDRCLSAARPDRPRATDPAPRE